MRQQESGGGVASGDAAAPQASPPLPSSSPSVPFSSLSPSAPPQDNGATAIPVGVTVPWPSDDDPPPYEPKYDYEYSYQQQPPQQSGKQGQKKRPLLPLHSQFDANESSRLVEYAGDGQRRHVGLRQQLQSEENRRLEFQDDLETRWERLELLLVGFLLLAQVLAIAMQWSRLTSSIFAGLRVSMVLRRWQGFHMLLRVSVFKRVLDYQFAFEHYTTIVLDEMLLFGLELFLGLQFGWTPEQIVLVGLCASAFGFKFYLHRLKLGMVLSTALLMAASLGMDLCLYGGTAKFMFTSFTNPGTTLVFGYACASLIIIMVIVHASKRTASFCYHISICLFTAVCGVLRFHFADTFRVEDGAETSHFKWLTLTGFIVGTVCVLLGVCYYLLKNRLSGSASINCTV